MSASIQGFSSFLSSAAPGAVGVGRCGLIWAGLGWAFFSKALGCLFTNTIICRHLSVSFDLSMCQLLLYSKIKGSVGSSTKTCIERVEFTVGCHLGSKLDKERHNYNKLIPCKLFITSSQVHIYIKNKNKVVHHLVSFNKMTW